jgi:uncharacterized protein YcbX
MPALMLSEIYVYPIKSLRGISVRHAGVEARGLRYDRRWMLVDEQGKFLSQRQQPRMSLVTVEIGPDRLTVAAPGLEPLHIPLETRSPIPIKVQVWRDFCEARLVGAEQDEWFSRFLGMPCHLVRMPDSTVRPVDPNYAVTNADQVGFADGYPFMLITQASLDDLNDRLQEGGSSPVPMIRFRPNLVVSGSEPFAEDHWYRIQINSMPFYLVKPCSRCVIPTVDPETGTTGKEPIRTLLQYRKKGDKIYFGQNLVHAAPDPGDRQGVLRVGDPVVVTDYRSAGAEFHSVAGAGMRKTPGEN